MSKWKEQVESGKMPRWEAIEKIDEATYQRFLEERERGSILHDYNLQRIMLEESRKIGWQKFKVTNKTR